MILNIVPGDMLAHQLSRLATVKAELLPGIITDEVQSAGSELVAELGQSAPRSGGTGGTPIEGDASGPLAESFSSQVEGSEGHVTLTVKTSQPTKLKFVTEGTGIHGPRGERIYPKVKRALYWEGATHPVRSVAGQEANDFVSPITSDAGDVIDSRVASVIGEALQLLVS
jgi:hypothetical protein